jgi:purine/pyrimidine-nucleoside phosphorylase
MIQVNEYFNGSVKSLAFENTDGKATVGIIEPGEYEFSTSSLEIMTIVSGELHVKLSDSEEWKFYSNNDIFRVEKGSKFKVKASKPVAYWCIYI